MESLKVSVIIPYNKDRGWLSEAVESVRLQTYNNYELILMQSEATVGKNINDGIKTSAGDLIRYLCEDDLLTVNSLSSSVKYFSENPDIDFIHSNSYNFIEDNIEEFRPGTKVPTLQSLLRKNTIHCGTIIYRKKCFDKKLFDESLWTAEEYDLNLWLLKNNYKVGYLNAFTYRYRRHDSQKSINTKAVDKAYQIKRDSIKTLIRERYV